MRESCDLADLIDRYLAHHVAFHPVDATFMGLDGGDHRLPPVGRDAIARERASLQALRRGLDDVPEPHTAGERLDRRLLDAVLTHATAALDCWPRHHQPTWYTGEAAFGVVSLLLPSAPADAASALLERVAALPTFLDAGSAAIADHPMPRDWCERARRECAALQHLLGVAVRAHPIWHESLAPACAAAAAAAARFAAALNGHPTRDRVAGRDYLGLLMRDVHALPWSPQDAVAFATEAFQRLDDEIRRRRGGQAIPADEAVSPSDLPKAYEHWHRRALAEAGGLLTPATDYALAFEPLPEWARAIAGEFYFLSYRSPPALRAGSGSIYWTAAAPQPIAAVKQTHAVHHGSIGHHTQNARARSVRSRLARLGGTDCASGIAFLAAGTMVEGWACYATGLMAEVPGFYSPGEEIAHLEAERRNAASVLADIRLHTGEWSLERVRTFYRDEAGFPPSRIWAETTRNSILPATRLMYFLGTEQIRALRRKSSMPTRDFHDALLSFGHVPVAWAGEEILRSESGDAARRS